MLQQNLAKYPTIFCILGTCKKIRKLTSTSWLHYGAPVFSSPMEVVLRLDCCFVIFLLHRREIIFLPWSIFFRRVVKLPKIG